MPPEVRLSDSSRSTTTRSPSGCKRTLLALFLGLVNVADIAVRTPDTKDGGCRSLAPANDAKAGLFGGFSQDRLPFGAENDPVATAESNRRAKCLVASQVIAWQWFVPIRSFR